MSKAAEHAASCVHCGLCTKKCTFLSKYNMDLKGFSERKDLAYHCFLCGDCSAVCPKGIDGREVALAMRRESVEQAGGKVTEPGYGSLIWEKNDYKFRNYKKGKGKTVLFPGCNFPSFFPKTTDALIALLREKADIGVVFDCCGKPVKELGLAKDEEKYIAGLNKRLRDAGIEEIVVLCPNCYYYLKPRLEVPMVNIYDKLTQLGLGNKIAENKANIFVPCPDKKTLELQKAFMPFIEGESENIPGVQCCGLGGCAAGKEPELSAGFRNDVKERNLDNVYAYCASCAGCLCRSGVTNVHHVLVDILGTKEESELSMRSLWNRAKRVF